MKTHFQREKDRGPAIGATRTIATLAMLAMCCTFASTQAGAEDNIISSECAHIQSDLHRTNAGTGSDGNAYTHHACMQGEDNLIHTSAKPDTSSCTQARSTSSRISATTNDNVNLLTLATLPNPDRHWCIAEAFNATLEQRKPEFPTHQPQTIVLR